MKSLFLALLLIASFYLAKAQTYPSSCTSDASMHSTYHNDACRLTIKRLKEIQSPFADSISIPGVFIDSIEKALFAIHNIQNATVADTIRGFFGNTDFTAGSDSTHIFSAGNSYSDAYGLKQVRVAVRNDVSWAADWATGNYTAGSNDSVNYLINHYQLSVSLYTSQPSPGRTVYLISSPVAINAGALAKMFEKFSGVGTGYANEITPTPGGNKIIRAEYAAGIIYLSYMYGCGDCPSGCTIWRIWKFAVHTGSGCNVDYISIQNLPMPLMWLSYPCLDYMETIEVCPSAASAEFQTDYAGAVQWQVSTDEINYSNISDNSYYTGSNTASLHLNNIPSSWNGYRYRVLSNGVSTRTYFKIRFVNYCSSPATGNWEDVTNWSCGILPDSHTDVVIRSGTILLNTDVTIRTLTILPGAALNIAPGKNLTVLH
ncbi:MAG: hypothetical protein QM687_14310 [Ferruginibacter sp.]